MPALSSVASPAPPTIVLKDGRQLRGSLPKYEGGLAYFQFADDSGKSKLVSLPESQIDKDATAKLQNGDLLEARLLRAVVSMPLPGSPAEIVGLQSGDVILTINGEPQTFREVLSYPYAAELVVIEVERAGRIVSFTVPPRRSGAQYDVGLAVTSGYASNN